VQAVDLDPPDPRVRGLRWTIAALLALGFGACMAKGADQPADPKVVESRVDGFGEIGFRITPAGGGPTPTEQCALLAATAEQSARGLMEVTDLQGYAGMVFRFPTDHTGAFYMRNTPMPLSIAWFAGDGSFVSAADMPPCEDREDCPRYGAAGPYRYALEVPQGGLGALGAAPGAKLELTGGCPAT
jgi:uncharacterized membrane protein (UPF0127 family)